MKPVNPTVKAFLEWGPVILFFVVFMRLKDRTIHIGGTDYAGFVVATMVFVPVLVLATLALWRLTGKLSVMQILTLILVVVMGGLTVWLNDERFLKMKPTFLYMFFAATLGTGLALRRNWLGAVMGEAVPMQPEGWRILTRRFVMLFVALAAANEFVWRTMSDQAWVYFKTFGLPVLLIGFIVANAGLFTRYALPKED